MLQDLRSFIDLLRDEREIAVIDAAVSSDLEIAEIHRRVIAAEGPALLFTNVVGADFPLVTNLFGTKKRVELAFGKRPEELVREIASLPHSMMPPTLGKLWSHRALFGSLAKVGLTRKSRGPVTEVVQTKPRLSRLPLLKTWPEDGGHFITLPLVYTEHPSLKIGNLGMYRMHRYDDAATGLHCQIGKGGGFHMQIAKERGEKLPVNVFLGGPPALILSAIAPLPENVPEMLLASLVMGKKLALINHPDSKLPLVSGAEFVLSGEVDPTEMHPEGPFGDHYGYYSLKHDYPLFRIKRIFHRRDAIFPATVVGKPRQEDFYLGDYLQQLLSPLFPVVMPSVLDLWSYGETGYHSLAAAVVQERYKREALVSAFRILGEGQLALTKFLLLTNERQNLRDFKALLEHVLARFNPETDLYIFSHMSMDTLDYAGPRVNEGSKGVLVGIGEAIRELPGDFLGTLPAGIRKAIPFARGCLVLEASDSFLDDKTCAERACAQQNFAAWPLLILVDDATKATRSTQDFLWTTFTRFEPAADIKSKQQRIARGHVAHTGPICIDARMKPWYPGELFCDSTTSNLVDSRWSEYFASK